GTLDACTPQAIEEFSEETAPFGTGDTVALVINDSPTPLLPVEIEITVKADLGSSLEFLILSLNDVDIDYVLNYGGKDCPTDAQVCKIYIPAEDYAALLDENRVAAFELRTSAFVSSVECSSSFASMAVRFRTDTADCNNNGTPDLCEIDSGDVEDAEGNGVPDNCERVVRGDQNRDGKADLVYFNPATRRIVFQYLNGLSTEDTQGVLTTVGNGYTVVAQGDLDGDGQPDYVLRGNTNGLTYGWLMDGADVSSFAQMGYTLSSTRYTVLTMADVDGDGDDDIIWLDGNDKKVYAWRMAGTTLLGGGLIANSTGLAFLGAGDVDNDGDDDFLFKNTTTGITRCWVIEDGAVALDVPVSGGATLPSQWQGRGMADVNGDGKEDLFWRNSTTGALFVWYLDGTTQIGGGQVGYNPGPSVDIATIGDLDGDGDPDLLWRAPSGAQVFAWILDERTFVNGGVLVTIPTAATVIAP
ncbi:MAG: FG-GAP repeat domain-containing protein, partial [Planctomycetota bacterium]